MRRETKSQLTLNPRVRCSTSCASTIDMSTIDIVLIRLMPDKSVAGDRDLARYEGEGLEGRPPRVRSPSGVSIWATRYGISPCGKGLTTKAFCSPSEINAFCTRSLCG